MSEVTETNLEIPDSEFDAAISPPDLKGRINLRIDTALQQEIEDIADDSRYPLNSASEVVRYCCLHGLERLRQWKPSRTLLGSIKAASTLVLRDKIQCASIDLLERLDERVNWYIEREHFDEVIDLCARVKANFDGYPDDFWAAYIQTELDKRFAGYLDRIDAIRKD